MAPPSLTSKVLHAPRDWLRKVRRAGRQFLFRPSISREGILKLPLAIFFRGLCQSGLGSWVKAFQIFRTPLPPSSPLICEINSLADFQTSYSHLARILGHPGKTPPTS